MYYIVTELERRPYGYDTIEEAVEEAETHFPACPGRSGTSMKR